MEQTIAYKSRALERSGSPLYRIFSIILSFLGLAIAIYLLYRHHVVTANESGRIDVCTAVFGKGCDTALKSSASTQLGLPLAGWGIIYYTVLLSLFFLNRLMGESFKPQVFVLLFSVSLLGAIGSIVLITLMIADPSMFCPFCFVIHLINLGLFFLITRLTGNQLAALAKAPGWFDKVLFSKSATVEMKWKLAGPLLIFFIALSVFFGLKSLSSSGTALPDVNFNLQNFLSDFDKYPQHNIPVDPDDPVLGPRNSPVEFIIFSDFQCPSCKFFSQVVVDLGKLYPGKFHVVFKHFPLGTACNNSISNDVHPRACEAALASEAARQQGKFWEYHDALFATDLARGDETLCSLAIKLGLDHQFFEQARTGDSARKKLDRTIELGKRLGVTGTPAVFMNGRIINDFRLKPLQALMDHLLQSTSKAP